MNDIDEFVKDLNTRSSAEREKTNERVEGHLMFAQEVPADFMLTLSFPSTKKMDQYVGQVSYRLAPSCRFNCTNLMKVQEVVWTDCRHVTK